MSAVSLITPRITSAIENCTLSIAVSTAGAYLVFMERTMVRPRVLLADDHSDLPEAEIALLRPHFELVGTASDVLSCPQADGVRLDSEKDFHWLGISLVAGVA